MTLSHLRYIFAVAEDYAFCPYPIGVQTALM